MIKSALQYFLDVSKPEMIYVSGKAYCSHKLYKVEEKPLANSLKMNTLSGLVKYITKFSWESDVCMIVHVLSPTCIKLISGLNEDRNREVLVTSDALLPDIYYSSFLEKEKFNIMLQSCFVPNKDRALLLQFTGTIESGTLAQYSDDGITQKATIKTGIASKGDAIVPNPVKLKPFRTFIEVDQPESDFIFRMREDKIGGITCALYEADGGAWKIEAMQNIKMYLQDALKGNEDITIIS